MAEDRETEPSDWRPHRETDRSHDTEAKMLKHVWLRHFTDWVLNPSVSIRTWHWALGQTVKSTSAARTLGLCNSLRMNGLCGLLLFIHYTVRHKLKVKLANCVTTERGSSNLSLEVRSTAGFLFYPFWQFISPTWCRKKGRLTQSTDLYI